MGWLKVAAVGVLAGTFVPGLAFAAKVPARRRWRSRPGAGWIGS